MPRVDSATESDVIRSYPITHVSVTLDDKTYIDHGVGTVYVHADDDYQVIVRDGNRHHELEKGRQYWVSGRVDDQNHSYHLYCTFTGSPAEFRDDPPRSTETGSRSIVLHVHLHI